MNVDEAIVKAAQVAGAPFGITGEQFLAWVAMGDRRHPDAPGGECGAIDPRDDSERTWCRRPSGMCQVDGMHNRYRMEDEWPT